MRLRKSSSYGEADRVVHNHQCHPIGPLPLSIHLLILSLVMSQREVIITLNHQLLRFVLMEKTILVHNC
jgi:hypothetical protein